MLQIPDTFQSWARHKWKTLIPAFTVSLVPAVFTISKQIKQMPDINPHNVEILLVWFQAASIFVLKLLIARPLKDTTGDQRKLRPGKGVDQFVEAWRWLWLFWLIEYIVLAVHETVPEALFLGPVFLNLCNNLTVVGLAMCYYVAGHKTVAESGEARPLPWQISLGILAVVTGINYLATLLHMPHDDLVFARLSGLAACLGTALLVGRLDSKYIGLPTWIMVALYSYAAIQPMWVDVLPHENEIFRSIAVNCALAMKFLLFLVVQWSLESGVLFFYADRIEGMFDTIGGKRKLYLDKLQNGDFLPD